MLSITGANTFANFTANSGWGVSLPSANTTTVSNAFTWTGTQANPILLASSSPTAIATLSVPSGACTLTWGGLQGITASGGATFTATNTFNFGTNSGWSISAPADATTVAPTAAQIASAVWKDTTSGDFTVAGSIGKDLFIGGVVPGAAGGHFIAGTNAATTITTALTTTFTGNLTGSVGSVTGLTASNLDTTVSSRMATYTQPTGFLAATFPSGTIANTTNITAGTITTATDLTNLPSIPTNWLTATGIAANALNGKGDWLLASSYTAPTNLTAAQIATGVWQDATAGDFTTANSVGKSLYNAFTANTSVYTTAALANAPTGGTPPTVGQIATAVWQDSTAGDFTAANSIGKSVLNGVALGTGLTVAAVSGAVGSVMAGVTVTTNNDKTGYSLTQAFPTNFGALSITAGGHISNVDTLTTYTGDTPQTGDSFARIGAAGAGLTALGDPRIAHLDADVSSRLATSGYTAPDNADVAAIKAKTDSLAFTAANKVDANILAVNSDTVTGDGHTGTEWGPA